MRTRDDRGEGPAGGTVGRSDATLRRADGEAPGMGPGEARREDLTELREAALARCPEACLWRAEYPEEGIVRIQRPTLRQHHPEMQQRCEGDLAQPVRCGSWLDPARCPAQEEGRSGQEVRGVVPERPVGSVDAQEALHLGDQDRRVRHHLLMEQPPLQPVEEQEDEVDVGLRIRAAPGQPVDVGPASRRGQVSVLGRCVHPDVVTGLVLAGDRERGVDEGVVGPPSLRTWKVLAHIDHPAGDAGVPDGDLGARRYPDRPLRGVARLLGRAYRRFVTGRWHTGSARSPGRPEREAGKCIFVTSRSGSMSGRRSMRSRRDRVLGLADEDSREAGGLLLPSGDLALGHGRRLLRGPGIRRWQGSEDPGDDLRGGRP